MSLYLLFLLQSASLGRPVEEMTAVVMLSSGLMPLCTEHALTQLEIEQLLAVHPAQQFS